jgi:hypothetical protein
MQEMIDTIDKFENKTIENLLFIGGFLVLLISLFIEGVLGAILLIGAGLLLLVSRWIAIKQVNEDDEEVTQ